jgi:5'(3')-deoxyribonucleotidase
MRILLDIDGVCADFLTPCLSAINSYTGLSFTADVVKDWDIMQSLHIPEATAREIYTTMEVPGLCRDIELYEGAAEGVHALRELGDVWAVTAPFGGPYWMYERDQWLVEKLGFRKNDILHVRSDAKHAVSADFLIEDKVSTLVSWSAKNPKGHGVLFRRLYNTHSGWKGVAASTWPDIVTLVDIMCP